MRNSKVYAIEIGADGKTVHSFATREQRDRWVAEKPLARAGAVSTSKTVLAAQYRETIVAHQEAL